MLLLPVGVRVLLPVYMTHLFDWSAPACNSFHFTLFTFVKALL